jgi:Mg2+ and Co2+ transporter CorA
MCVECKDFQVILNANREKFEYFGQKIFAVFRLRSLEHEAKLLSQAIPFSNVDVDVTDLLNISYHEVVYHHPFNSRCRSTVTNDGICPTAVDRWFDSCYYVIIIDAIGLQVTIVHG